MQIHDKKTEAIVSDN